jgi:filamentous hemagglutinin family protein
MSSQSKYIINRSLRVQARPLVLALAAAFNLAAHAAPQGGNVVSGGATFQQNGSQLLVRNTPGAIINWQSFNIGRGESVWFQQTGAHSAVLNRVIGGSPSEILGYLGSNGRVFLINSSGILFGQGAVLDTAGFVASTLNLSDADWKAGRIRLSGGSSSGDIVLSGAVRASNGDVYLIARNIDNNGALRVENGHAILAAGERIELISQGLDGVKFEVGNGTGQVRNLGSIQAGAVGLFANSLTHSGDIRATGVQQEASGRMFLGALAGHAGGDLLKRHGVSASMDLAATDALVHEPPGAKSSGAVRLIGVDSVNLSRSSTIDVSQASGVGGEVIATANKVVMEGGARINASGAYGGGTVLLGGGWQGKDARVTNAKTTILEQGAVINADAITAGNGGTVVAWSDGLTVVDGVNISARGGAKSGDGGNVETSGKRLIGFAAPDLRAANGKTGNWLIDPDEIVIEGGSPVITPIPFDGTITGPDAPSIVYESQLEAFTGANILLQAEYGIRANGTFNNNDLVLNANTTMETRNAVAPPKEVSAGIDLSIIGQLNVTGKNSLTLSTGQLDGKQVSGALPSNITLGNIDASRLNINSSGDVTLQSVLSPEGINITLAGGNLNVNGGVGTGVSGTGGVNIFFTGTAASKLNFGVNGGIGAFGPNNSGINISAFNAPLLEIIAPTGAPIGVTNNGVAAERIDNRNGTGVSIGSNSLALSGPISIRAQGGQASVSLSAIGAAGEIRMTEGYIRAFDGTVNDITLSAGGNVSMPVALTADELALSVNGNAALTGANQIGTLYGSVNGSLAFANNLPSGLRLGLDPAFVVEDINDGKLTVDGNFDLTAMGGNTLIANEVRSVNGSVSLSGAQNIGFGTAGNVQAANEVTLAVSGNINGSAGRTTAQITANRVNLQAGGAIAATVNAQELAAVGLPSSNPMAIALDASHARIAAANPATGDINLTNLNADSTLVAAATTGTVSVSAAGNMRVGGVLSAAQGGGRGTVQGQNVTLNATNNLVVNTDVSAANSVGLIAGGALEVNANKGPITIQGGGNVSLQGASISLTAGAGTDSVAVRSNGGLSLGSQGVVQLNGNGGSVGIEGRDVTITGTELRLTGGSGADAYAGIRYSNQLRVNWASGAGLIALTPGAGVNADAFIFGPSRPIFSSDPAQCINCTPTWTPGTQPTGNGARDSGISGFELPVVVVPSDPLGPVRDQLSGADRDRDTLMGGGAIDPGRRKEPGVDIVIEIRDGACVAVAR